MKNQEARARLRRLLQSQPLGVLAVGGTETMHATLVAIAATEDLRQVILATSRATRKFELMRRNPRAALLVDDRTNQVSDFRDAQAATAHGLAAEVEAGNMEEMRALYLGRHPYLEEFVRAPTCALMSIAVETYDLVGNFQEVHVLRVGDGLAASD
jgi:nitroimidazol reductase NimA-like FMN-containing flavoprotein (pyridoxamine 5'-phosphate oxidase superfamily)